MGRKLKVFLKALETMEERREMYPLVDVHETYVPHTQKDLVDSQAQTDPGMLPRMEGPASTSAASSRRNQRSDESVEMDSERELNANRISPRAEDQGYEGESKRIGEVVESSSSSPQHAKAAVIRGSASEIPLLFVGEEEEAGAAFGVIHESEGYAAPPPQQPHSVQPPSAPSEQGTQNSSSEVAELSSSAPTKGKEDPETEVQMVVIRDAETAESLFGVVPIPDLVDFIL